MAKQKDGQGESVGGYFRKKLLERPDLIDVRSNREVLDMWLADNPSQKEVPVNVKQGLSNVKNHLRKKSGKKKSKKRGRPAKASVGTNGAAPKTIEVSAAILDKLELQIDECLTLARQVGADSLGKVIDLLRKARHAVVWQQAE